MTATPDAGRDRRRPAGRRRLALPHAHLRLGSLALARAELETLAGAGGLDTLGPDRPGRGPLADR